MKVIIYSRQDGSCSVVNPAPEMFDPNSRTIRHLESSGVVFGAVSKVFSIELEKQARIISDIREADKEASILSALLNAEDATQEVKDAALQRIQDLAKQSRSAADKFNAEQAAYEADRNAHPSFDLQKFQEEAIEFVIERNGLKGQDYRIAEQSDLPADRYFRNAWKDEAGVIEIDMIKARDIHRDNIRIARGPLMQGLDVEFIKAIAKDNKQQMAVVEGLKQGLRDAPGDPAIEDACSPEELKKVWPDILTVPV